jgi:gluconate 2-dehydrogenase gamma chain
LLSQQQQLEIVSDLSEQDRDFFELVRGHTLEGYYGSPRHGGNRDAVSWRMLGLPEPPPLGRAQYDLRKGSPS